MCSSTGPTVEASDEVPPPSPYSRPLHVGTIGISGQMFKSLRSLLTSWILLSQDTETGKILVIPQQFTMDTLLSSMGPEMQDFGRLLQELELAGAELVSINGTPCRGAPVDQVQDLLILMEGAFTMIFSKADGDEWTKRVIILKPPGQDGAPAVLEEEEGASKFWADLSCTLEPVEAEPSTENYESIATSTGNANTKLSPKTRTAKKVVRKELCLGPIPDSHPQWMKQTPLDEGDRILDLNQKKFVQELSPEDAQLTISTLFHCAPVYLSLLVRTPPSKRGPRGASWRKHLRKGAVAFSGSAMVGAGAVLMVTPLHPLGHAMAIGGVGVLGTEFKGPRQVAKRASSGFSNFASNMRQSWHTRRERRAVACEDHAKNRFSTDPSASFASDSTRSISSAPPSMEEHRGGVSTNY